jgi:S1-C subfamily serine protease
MKYFIFSTLLFFSIISFSQSLNPERVAKIKAATVRITIDSSNSTGTGFFINDKGWLLTCYHVIEPAIEKNKIQKIFVQLKNGEKFQVIAVGGTNNYRDASIAYDFALLIPKEPIPQKTSFLKFGDYNRLQEGEQIYTCGYPLSITQQFISTGYVSTKYAETLIGNYGDGRKNIFIRQQALLDLTLNTGNSGGAIMSMGATPEDDRVIGIADFIIIPYGKILQKVNEIAKNAKSDFKIGGLSNMKVNELFSSALMKAMNGLSGCISIDHFLQASEVLQKEIKK